MVYVLWREAMRRDRSDEECVEVGCLFATHGPQDVRVWTVVKGHVCDCGSGAAMFFIDVHGFYNHRSLI